jgi:hypothetical protein
LVAKSDRATHHREQNGCKDNQEYSSAFCRIQDLP